MNRQLDQFGEPDGRPAFASLAEARAAAQTCARCALATTWRAVVFGSGGTAARLVVVGEGPSEVDELSGRPFSGPAGRLLDAWLKVVGLGPEHVWLTNAVRCPPARLEGGQLQSRPPHLAEVAACQHWMDVELRLLPVEVVLCVGATAARALMGRDFQLARDRGRWRHTANGTPALATYNPAYVLRLDGEARRRAEAAVADDLASVRARLQA